MKRYAYRSLAGKAAVQGGVQGAVSGAIFGAIGGGLGSAGGKGKPSCDSFAGNTRVLMADGTTKPISSVRVGDTVTTTEPKSGATSRQPVTALHVNRDRDLADVTVRDSKTGSASVVHTTQHHLFWDVTAGAWTAAAALTVGHHLRTTTGTQAMITAVGSRTATNTMHNLTVDATHTYYVMAGTTPVLVHNAGSDRIPYPERSQSNG